MVNNFLCENCSKYSVCRNADIINKFQDDVKRPLGINITMDDCFNYEDSNDNEVKDGDLSE